MGISQCIQATLFYLTQDCMKCVVFPLLVVTFCIISSFINVFGSGLHTIRLLFSEQSTLLPSIISLTRSSLLRNVLSSYGPQVGSSTTFHDEDSSRRPVRSYRSSSRRSASPYHQLRCRRSTYLRSASSCHLLQCR